MQNRWTLHIRNFGKIQSADIQMSPMTLFVGDNNSGKSYIMALLYSIFNIRFRSQRFDLCSKSTEFSWCAEWLKTQFTQEAHELAVDAEIRGHFEALLNLILAKNKSKIVLGALNEDVPIDEIRITLPNVDNQFLEFHPVSETLESEDNGYYKLSPKTGKKATTAARSEDLDVTFFISFLLEFFIKADFKTVFRQPPVFLPTSRTGFLLTYQTLLRETISNSYDSKETGDGRPSLTRLTRPCSDFLKNLSSISVSTTNLRFKTITNYIETEMLNGSLEISESPVSDISYRPRGCDHSLPMNLSSGVVTELAPLALMLRYHKPTEILFIEEPEMSLHPELQASIARVLIQIQATGVPVFSTTHSDTILQHINNMLKLKKQPSSKRKKLMEHFGYKTSDLLDEFDIAMYQFDVSKDTGRTVVSQLEQSDFGFVVPTFNEALKNLLNQSREFEPVVFDDDD